MSYEKTTWETGDTITAEKLNNLEGGVERAQPNVEFFIIHVTEAVDEQFNKHFTADKTFSEIVAAANAGKILAMTDPEAGGMYIFPSTYGGNSGNITDVEFQSPPLIGITSKSSASYNRTIYWFSSSGLQVYANSGNLTGTNLTDELISS